MSSINLKDKNTILTGISLALAAAIAAVVVVWALRGRQPHPTTAGVTKVSENHYAIDKAYLSLQLENLNALLQSARAVPYLSGGTLVGFRLEAIEPDSFFLKLGLQEGDIATGINQVEFTNPGQGLIAFQQLRGATNVDLRLLRQNKPLTIHYDIIEPR
jgi:type II secretion system protein C